MPAENNPEVGKWLVSTATTLVTASVVAFWAWLAKWKLQQLSHTQLVQVVAEQRAYIEEKERLLVGLREELEKVQARCTENGRRQEDLDKQILELVGRQHRRERWIKRVVILCEGSGVTLPPWED